MRYLIILVALVLFSSCNPSDPEVDQAPIDQTILQKDKDHKVVICHKADDVTYIKIEIAKSALDAHLAHGDGSPGEAVPGMEGYVFTEECECEEMLWECGQVWTTANGYSFETVLIGNQCWLKENLNVGTMMTNNSAMIIKQTTE